VQAVGAAPILALGIAIVTESFPPSERGKALGIAGGTVSVGVVLGPALGGLILDAFSWHWIFLVNVPVGIAGTLLALRFVPDVRPPGAERFDLVGAVLLFAGLLSLLLALTLGQQLTFTAPLILALFAAFLMALALFIRHELGHPQPLIDLRLFRNLHFSVNLAAGFITFVAIAGSVILVPFYLEGVLGLPTRDVGLLLAVTPMVLAVTAPLAGSLSDRLGTRPITVTGLLILAAGYALMSTLDADVTTLGFVARFLPVGIGMGVFQSPNNSAVMGAAPRERLGIASGLLAITRSLGQTAGIAVLGALWAARVFAAVGQTLPGGATAAPPSAQVVALHETFLGVTALMLLALGLNVWAWQRERRQAQQAYASTH
jgi:EmrB/QacA subfamily drug resistance transporter